MGCVGRKITEDFVVVVVVIVVAVDVAVFFMIAL